LAAARGLAPCGFLGSSPKSTGALDDATEKALMETLAGLSRDLTIILLHRDDAVHGTR
jgi:ABC-type lipoprotein export system ATPase subunit